MKINFQNLKQSHQLTLLVVDFLMMGLIIINLVWIVFDSLFNSQLVQNGLGAVAPAFTEFYAREIHADFISIDLIFVAIFITELLIRWLVAIINKTYHRWFFYPFVHWYDVLGCIPVGSFRWLRLLRVISILYRLQRYGIINLSNTMPGKFVVKYYNVLVEEVSDRVVINVLEGAKEEVEQGSPIVEKIVTDVVLPRKAFISGWLTARINEVCEDVYLPNQESLKHYIDEKISLSIERERKARALDALPVLGPKIVEEINRTVSDVVYGVVDQLLIDVGKQETDMIVSDLLEGVIHKLLQPGDTLNETSREILMDAIDIIIEQVSVQRWKLPPPEPKD